jgi:hypothetical protein
MGRWDSASAQNGAGWCDIASTLPVSMGGSVSFLAVVDPAEVQYMSCLSPAQCSWLSVHVIRRSCVLEYWGAPPTEMAWQSDSGERWQCREGISRNTVRLQSIPHPCNLPSFPAPRRRTQPQTLLVVLGPQFPCRSCQHPSLPTLAWRATLTSAPEAPPLGVEAVAHCSSAQSHGMAPASLADSMHTS